MTEFRDQGVTAFIGPDKSCRQEALVASAWNLPMIAFVSVNFKQFYNINYPSLCYLLNYLFN